VLSFKAQLTLGHTLCHNLATMNEMLFHDILNISLSITIA